jgi:hypothetical protein
VCHTNANWLPWLPLLSTAGLCGTVHRGPWGAMTHLQHDCSHDGSVRERLEIHKGMAGSNRCGERTCR